MAATNWLTPGAHTTRTMASKASHTEKRFEALAVVDMARIVAQVRVTVRAAGRGQTKTPRRYGLAASVCRGWRYGRRLGEVFEPMV